MSLQELISVLAPPKRAIDTPMKSQWSELHELLGFQLPKDYRDFIECYGSGYIGGFLAVISPFGHPTEYEEGYVNYASRFSNTAEYVRDVVAAFPDTRFPYAVFPDPDGLFPCGQDTNGNCMCWLRRSNKPDEWPIVMVDCAEADLVNEIFEMSMTTFLKNVVTHKMHFSRWPESFTNPGRRIDFTPI